MNPDKIRLLLDRLEFFSQSLKTRDRRPTDVRLGEILSDISPDDLYGELLVYLVGTGTGGLDPGLEISKPFQLLILFDTF